MGKRRKPGPHHQEPPADGTGRTCGRLPWDGLSEAELAELAARGHGALPPGWLIGESTGGLFDEP